MDLIWIIYPGVTLGGVDVEEGVPTNLLKAEEVETPIGFGSNCEKMNFVILGYACQIELTELDSGHRQIISRLRCFNILIQGGAIVNSEINTDNFLANVIFAFKPR